MKSNPIKSFLFAAVMAATLPACQAQAQTAPFPVNEAGVPISLATVACLELEPDVAQIAQIVNETHDVDIAYDVVVDNPILSTYQRFILMNYLFAIRAQQAPIPFNAFLEVCVAYIGSGQTTSTQAAEAPARQDI